MRSKSKREPYEDWGMYPQAEADESNEPDEAHRVFADVVSSYGGQQSEAPNPRMKAGKKGRY